MTEIQQERQQDQDEHRYGNGNGNGSTTTGTAESWQPFPSHSHHPDLPAEPPGYDEFEFSLPLDLSPSLLFNSLDPLNLVSPKDFTGSPAGNTIPIPGFTDPFSARPLSGSSHTARDDIATSFATGPSGSLSCFSSSRIIEEKPIHPHLRPHPDSTVSPHPSLSNSPSNPSSSRDLYHQPGIPHEDEPKQQVYKRTPLSPQEYRHHQEHDVSHRNLLLFEESEHFALDAFFLQLEEQDRPRALLAAAEAAALAGSDGYLGEARSHHVLHHGNSDWRRSSLSAGGSANGSTAASTGKRKSLGGLPALSSAALYGSALDEGDLEEGAEVDAEGEADESMSAGTSEKGRQYSMSSIATTNGQPYKRVKLDEEAKGSGKVATSAGSAKISSSRKSKASPANGVSSSIAVAGAAIEGDFSGNNNNNANTTATPRSKHIASEQRRRTTIKENYKSLVDLLLEGEKHSGISLSGDGNGGGDEGAGEDGEEDVSGTTAKKGGKGGAAGGKAKNGGKGKGTGRGRGRKGQDGAGATKSVVLERAADYLRWLERGNRELKVELDRIEAALKG